jgi:cytosine/adenosine deaminase-related metal-dependent hydrolase
MTMARSDMSRRTLLKGATALGGLVVASPYVLAQPARTAKGPIATLPPRGEFVIRGARVLTMDPKIADLASGDVHVRDGAIVAVAAKVDAPKAPVIAGDGMICIPGFIDTHWHLWTSLFRTFVRSDQPAVGYFPVSNRLGQLMLPEDSYRSAILGCAEALSAGVTAVHNWCHNVRSPEHADAELSAMRDAGIRGRFAYGPAQGMANEEPMDFAGMARVQKEWMPNDGMLTLGINSRNVSQSAISAKGVRGLLTVDQAKRDWDGARKLGLPITLHTSGPSPIKTLEDAGLLGPDVQLVHPMLTTAEERAIMQKRGVSYSMSPTAEARRASNLGVIQFGELLEAGVKISLSTDHTTNYSCDPFGAMRILFTLHQHRLSNKPPLTMKRLVQLGTIDGAVDLGIAERTGSLTPGKRADIILVRTTDANMAPLGDPYEALVSHAQPGNVDTVIVDGRVLRRGGKFTALDHAKVVREAQEAAAGLRAKAKWPA